MKKSYLFYTSLLTFNFHALAQSTTTAASKGPIPPALMNLVPILLMGLLFYFGIIAPQRNQQKKLSTFLANVGKGEEVVTASGIIGKVTGISDKVITLEVDQGTELKVLKTQLQGYLKDLIGTTTATK